MAPPTSAFMFYMFLSNYILLCAIIAIFLEIDRRRRERRRRIASLLVVYAEREEETQRAKRRKITGRSCWMYATNPGYWENIASKYSDSRFMKKYRLSRVSFNQLCEELRP